MNEVFISILGSIGATSALILGLSSWLGKVWAKRILEKDKFKYQQDIELVKKKYEIQFDSLKAVLLRYSENQFNIYTELWSSLCELKFISDELWLEATFENVAKLSKQLNHAKFWLEKSSIFIEDEHYQSLNSVFDSFEQFLFGKECLLDKKNLNLTDGQVDDEIKLIVDQNRWYIENLANTLNEMRWYFKKHISGTDIIE